MSSYYVENKKTKKYIKINRFLKISDNAFTLRKSYDFHGYFVSSLFEHKNPRVIFSSGVNNSVLENPINIFELDIDTNKYKKLEILEELREKMFDS
jgi:hypothetical protein